MNKAERERREDLARNLASMSRSYQFQDPEASSWFGQAAAIIRSTIPRRATEDDE